MATAIDLYRQADDLKEKGDLEGAINVLNELLEQDETHTLAHSALAVYYGKTDQHELAVKHAERVCELEPENAFNYTALSVVYQRAYAGTQNTDYIPLAENAMARSQMMRPHSC
jgi:Tfp pilus assembly protein PilF